MNTYNSRFTLCNGNAMTWHSRYFSWCFCWHHSSSGAATHPNVSRTLCPGCWAAAVDLRIPQICHSTLRLRKDIMFVRLWFKHLGRQAKIYQNIPRYWLDEYTARKYFPYFFVHMFCHDLSTLPLWFDPISQVHGLEPPHWDADPGGVVTWFPLVVRIPILSPFTVWSWKRWWPCSRHLFFFFSVLEILKMAAT